MGEESLWRAFVETAERLPSKDAVLQGDARTSFGELRRRAEDYRARFLEAGVEPGQRILLWMDASAETASALAASWGVGAIPVLVDSDARGPFLRQRPKRRPVDRPRMRQFWHHRH